MKKDITQPLRQDFLNGMSFTAIGRKYSMDPRTAKRYVENNLPLEELEKRPFASVLDPYKDMIDRWLLNGLTKILHELHFPPARHCIPFTNFLSRAYCN